MHLKDLVSLHEAQPDRLPDGRLHLPKLNNLYLRLQELAALQRQHPPCSANEDLLHLLTVSRPAPPLPRLGAPRLHLEGAGVYSPGRKSVCTLVVPILQIGKLRSTR